MKPGTVIKGAVLSAAVLTAPEFSPEVAEAKENLSEAAQIIDVRDSLASMVEDCIVTPLNGGSVSSSCEVSGNSSGMMNAAESADDISETWPPAIIIGAGLVLSGMAIKDYLNKRRK